MYSVVIRMQVRANHAVCTCMRVWDGCKSAAFVLRFATRLGLHARCMNFSTRLALHAVIINICSLQDAQIIENPS